VVDNTIDPGVATTDFDGGGNPDYFLTFVVPFGDLVTWLGAKATPIAFDDDSQFQFIAATANQPNALNQDLGGIDGAVGSATTWGDLGGFSTPVEAAPEPGTALLLTAGLLVLAIRRRQL
jgi:hypothetical protein